MKSIKLLSILSCSLLLVNKESIAEDRLLWGTVGIYSGIALGGGLGKSYDSRNMSFYTSLFGAAANILIARSKLDSLDKTGLLVITNLISAMMVVITAVDQTDFNNTLRSQASLCIYKAEEKCKKILALIESLKQNKEHYDSDSMIIVMAHTQIDTCRNELKTDCETLRNLLVEVRKRASTAECWESYLKIAQQIERINTILG